jgi:hypothetical protein
METISQTTNDFIDSSEVEFNKLSLGIDDFGRVFSWNNRVFRAINNQRLEQVEHILKSGLIDELIRKKLFPNTWISNYKLDGYSLILEHEKIKIVTYPYEWSYAMILEAARSVLQVNIISRQYGYRTKDSHSYNILFDDLQPKFIDLGSFIEIDRSDTSWAAYPEFLSYYYYPMSMCRNGNTYMARRLLGGSQIISYRDYFLYKSSASRFLFQINKTLFRKIVDRWVFKSASNIDFPGLLKTINGRWGKLFRTQEFLRKTDQVIANLSLESLPGVTFCLEVIQKHQIQSVLEFSSGETSLPNVLLSCLKAGIPLKNKIFSGWNDENIDLAYEVAKGLNFQFTPILLDLVDPELAPFVDDPYKRITADLLVLPAEYLHQINSRGIPMNLILKKIRMYSISYLSIEFLCGPNKMNERLTSDLHEFESQLETFFYIIAKKKVIDRFIFFASIKT